MLSCHPPYRQPSGHLPVVDVLDDRNRPSDCNRTVTGFVNYQVVGWFVSSANVGFFIPITIINGAACVALVIAMLSDLDAERISVSRNEGNDNCIT
ncbi:hypothetical protein K443DRAFT_541776 [Laccaria amethystina LaAM-08-1]|uniref:Uncharacterized protein n=1 Tax=Laccaria amethystina LaAM-08-1 TaxID=1095629 RepID=A0A0C9XAW9_9AGAR|nr:hypothetical protein K443DRAFT_541776 [Laccaria amethystina LaAM-08-1]